MKRLSKLLCFMLVFITVMAAFCTVSFAVTVGQQLTNPEAGWQRYNDKDSLIVYTGSWVDEGASGLWLDDDKATNTYGATVGFKFYGTKLRIIGTTYTNRDAVINITIDGVLYNFSAASSDLKYQVIEFEKLDLPLSLHSVHITKGTNNTKYFTLDAIDIDATGYLSDNTQSTESPKNLIAAPGNAKVDLSWSAVEGATSYIVKRSLTPGGPYETITTTSAITYTDADVTNGTTYYYVVSAIVNGVGSSNSNEALATPTAPVVTGNPGILEITMVTGEIKEYDLTAAELQSFLNWYDSRSNGTDKAYYMITKKNNIKPFLSRKEYIAFDKISSFEVKEYTE